jgi:uncharacterized LabA/DUF88 family protein
VHKNVKRVITYIDGFNLYYGLKSKGWRRYYWLDPRQLGTELLRPGQELVSTKYFTARIAADPRDPDKHRRQQLFIEAIETLPETRVFYGHYLQKPQSCHSCGAKWMSHEEKMTDVNIAVELLSDAFDNAFDTAIVISADSDLAPPISLIRSRSPEKRIIVVCPPDRRSQRLESIAHGYFSIGRKTIQDSQFPDRVTKPNGFVLTRPMRWR